MEIIQSVNNSKVKFWSQLKTGKGRKEHQLFIIEGLKLIEEAFNSKQRIKTIIYDIEKGLPDNLLETINKNEKDITVYAVSENVINKLTETETPQGILAIVEQSIWNFNDLINNNPFFLLIDEIKDPGNLGAIIRSADAAGVNAIILGKGTVELYNPKVVRSTMGSIFHLPILEGNLDLVIPRLIEKGFKIVGTSPYGENLYYNTNFTEKVAIILGNESKGLSEERKKQVNEMVKIPIKGQAESLNVAMATTIILFERIRQLDIN